MVDSNDDGKITLRDFKLSNLKDVFFTVAAEEDINKVRELGKECAPVQVFFPMPAFRLVIAVISVPVTIELYEEDPAKAARFDHFLNPHGRRRIAVLH